MITHSSSISECSTGDLAVRAGMWHGALMVSECRALESHSTRGSVSWS